MTHLLLRNPIDSKVRLRLPLELIVARKIFRHEDTCTLTSEDRLADPLGVLAVDGCTCTIGISLLSNVRKVFTAHLGVRIRVVRR